MAAVRRGAYAAAMVATHIDETVAYDLNRDPWELMNLYPRDTGLPMTIWAAPRGGARHDARVKVCMTPGDRMIYDNVAVVAVRPEPRLLHGRLSAADLALVSKWVQLNTEPVMGYWAGELSSLEFGRALTKV